MFCSLFIPFTRLHPSPPRAALTSLFRNYIRNHTKVRIRFGLRRSHRPIEQPTQQKENTQFDSRKTVCTETSLLQAAKGSVLVQFALRTKYEYELYREIKEK